MDAAYGRLLAFLDKKGLTDNTIIVFTSDNGPEPHLIPWSDRARGSTGGLRGGKHELYDGGIREPAIVRWPGVTKPGSVLMEPTWTPDIVASLCAAANVSPPAATPFDGVDIRPAFEGKPLVRPEPLFWLFPYRGVDLKDGTRSTSPPIALRDGPWKLLCNEDFTGVELYDLNLDLNEKWNVKDDYPKVAARLLAEAKKRYQEVNQPYAQTADKYNPNMRLPDGKTLSDYPRYEAPGLAVLAAAAKNPPAPPAAPHD